MGTIDSTKCGEGAEIVQQILFTEEMAFLHKVLWKTRFTQWSYDDKLTKAHVRSTDKPLPGISHTCSSPRLYGDAQNSAIQNCKQIKNKTTKTIPRYRRIHTSICSQ